MAPVTSVFVNLHAVDSASLSDSQLPEEENTYCKWSDLDEKVSPLRSD